MIKIKYTNRYGDIYTFTKRKNGNILIEGDWKWFRVGFDNDYNEAYERYSNDVDTDERMTLGEFKVAVHEYIENQPTEFSKKYRKYIRSDTSKYRMIDPSGGPYLCSGLNMGAIDESFEGMIIDWFKPNPKGYLIITKNKRK